jgi:peptidoglycan hydrolase CwlO-like protein
MHHRRVRPALGVAGVLLVGLFVTTATPAVAQEVDPVAEANQAVAEADQAVAEAQAEVDRVAVAYFDALERTRQLEARIAELQFRIEGLRQRITELKLITSDRAVAAYKRSGHSLEIVFLDDPGAADTVRRIKVLDVLNAHDDEAVRLLHRSQDDLSEDVRELDAAREQQTSAAARLREQGEQVNAKLAAAQNLRQVAIEQQLEAQRQVEAAAAAAAAEAAAAAAAAQPPPPPAPPATQPPPGNAAPAPVAGYSPTGGVHPQHDHPYLRCVRYYESTNNYRAYNPAGPAYGAYQFLLPTWNLTVNRAGRGDLVGLDPRRASEYDQDDMAWVLYQWQGRRPWIVDPC